MSDKQQLEGFLDHQQQISRNIQRHKKLLASFQLKQNPQQQAKPLQKYIGLSNTLNIIKKQSQNEDDIDMFSNQPSKKIKKNESIEELQVTDESGYYKIYSGKIVCAGKYKIIQKIGKGMFGIVAKAKQLNNQEQFVALKIIRKNEMMILSGEKQYKILASIKPNDFIVGVKDYFFEDQHLFLTTELMGPDLRSYVRKNQDKITLDHIKSYAIAMFMSLHHLRKNKIIHADIKPDNFLLTEDLSKIKLTDFGTAFYVQEHNHEIQQLVARYYRAPQIILGCEMPIEHRYAIDTWAVGCSLYELFTGSFLFQGQNNNDMLKQIMQTKGKFNTKMLKKCLYFDKYFDNQFNFLYNSYDYNVKTNIVKKIQPVITSQRELSNLIKKNCRFDEDPKKIAIFKDFLQSCLSVNPKHRLTPQQAFQHPFLNYMIKLQ